MNPDKFTERVARAAFNWRMSKALKKAKKIQTVTKSYILEAYYECV